MCWRTRADNSGRWRATRTGNILDQKLGDQNRILSLKLLRLLSPAAACIRQRWFQFSLFSFGVVLLLDACHTTVNVSTYGFSRQNQINIEYKPDGAAQGRKSLQSQNDTTVCGKHSLTPTRVSCIRRQFHALSRPTFFTGNVEQPRN
jgi:hypothetical protein